MNKKLLSLLLTFLILGFVSSFAQEDEAEDIQAFQNPNFTQFGQQSVFEDSQPIYNSPWEWLHQQPNGNTLRWVKMWDANNWYAVGGGGTFLKTTDAGATWFVNKWINEGGTTGSNYFLYDGHFFDMNTGVVVGGGGKIMRTTDGGETWTVLDPLPSSISSLYDVCFLNDTLGYAAGSSTVDMYKTTDAGLTWTGPILIPTTFYRIYVVDENTVYGAGSSGNFHYSTDSGANWTTINVGTTSTIYDMEFTDPMNGWVSGVDDNPAYTSDGGLTWTETTASPTASTQYDIDVMSTTTYTLSESFTDVAFPPAGWHSKNLLGTNEWVRYTTSFNSPPASARISYQSTGGEDWLVTPQVPIVAGDSLKFFARKYFSSTYIPDSLYILVSTTDTAVASFTNVVAGFDVNAMTTTFAEFAVDLSAFAGMNVYVAFRHLDDDGNGMMLDDVTVGEPVLASQVYVTGNAINIFSTTDMGATWNPVEFLDPAQPWTSTFYSTDWLEPNNFVTVGGSGLINEVNPSDGIVAHTLFIKAGTLYTIWAESPIGRVIAAGAASLTTTFDQALYSTDGGDTWAVSTVEDSVDRDFNDISMVTSLIGYVAREDHYVSKTTDGGATWFPVTRPAVLTTDLETCSFIDENNGYVFGASGLGYKTTDGGTSWTTLTTGITGTIYSSYFLDATTGYIGGSSGALALTTDGGTTFTPLTSNMGTSVVYSIQMLNSNLGYLSGSTGKVRKTTDAGVTWDTVDVGNTSPTLYNVEFRDENNGMTAGSSGRSFYTNDGGATWNFENTSMSTIYGLYVEKTSPDTATVFVCGTSSYIMKNSHVVVPVELASFSASVNGSDVTLSWMTATELNNSGFQVERMTGEENWTELGFIQGHGTTSETQVYSFIDKGLAAGTYSYRIKQIDFNGSYKYYDLKQDVEIAAPISYALSQNYPNPFNPTTTIKYSVPVDGFVNIAVFNVLGEKVANVINSVHKAGNYELTFNATNLASGMYIYRMESGNYVSIKKMMILK